MGSRQPARRVTDCRVRANEARSGTLFRTRLVSAENDRIIVDGFFSHRASRGHRRRPPAGGLQRRRHLERSRLGRGWKSPCSRRRADCCRRRAGGRGVRLRKRRRRVPVTPRWRWHASAGRLRHLRVVLREHRSLVLRRALQLGHPVDGHGARRGRESGTPLSGRVPAGCSRVHVPGPVRWKPSAALRSALGHRRSSSCGGTHRSAAWERHFALPARARLSVSLSNPRWRRTRSGYPPRPPS
jgi:hypothetical protein